MPPNVIPFPAHTRLNAKMGAVNHFAEVIPLSRNIFLGFSVPREIELRALDRAITALQVAILMGKREVIREWLDELEIMEMYTDCQDIRERCRSARLGT